MPSQSHHAKSTKKVPKELIDDYHFDLEAPLLHDRLIRRFQTPSERAAEAKKKGYAGVLETDLWRSEAKMEALRKGTHKPRTSNKRANIKKDRVIGSTCVDSQGEDDGIDFDDIYELPSSKEEGLQIWREEMERRFLAGRDEDFDYGEVDAGHEDDGLEEAKEEEERWFEEDERWMEENEDGEEEREGKGHELKGQTGVQDF